MHKIIITPLAFLDLEEIWLYSLNKWSYNQANKYHFELDTGIKKIAKDPSIGNPMHHIKKGYRQHKVNHHYIFYLATKKEIRIIRVLHEKIDMPGHFSL